MKQLLDGLEAAGLKPIVIDENFGFSQLGGLIRPTYEELQECIACLCDLLNGSPDDTTIDAATNYARRLIDL